MTPEKTNAFAAVDFMGKRRDELSDLYYSNPDQFKKHLKQIQKKFQKNFRLIQKHTA